ncbi:MAG: type 2 lanthipeptide synthetase LanM, partial [Janthinobacterium lividum]
MLFAVQPDALPFQQVVTPFETFAVDRVMRLAPGGWRRLDDEAHKALRRPLLLTLTTYAAQSLQLEFSLWRTQHQSGLSRLLGAVYSGDDHGLYDDFCRSLRRGGLLDFFTEYAVLGRLLGTITDLWIDATVEFLQRLDADWLVLQDLFGTSGPLGRVSMVQPGLSDPHRGRRSVIVVSWDSGVRVVYKPKDLGIDQAFDQLLVWVNARPAPVTFRRTRLVVRSGYGWVEFVEHAPCRGSAEADRYYRGAGALLCLLHVLGATDCHYENIIAAGEHPVAIDLETLLRHHSAEEDERGTDAERRAIDELGRSALATGMLPVWQLGDGGSTVYDVSGLGGLDQQATDFEAAVWSHVNTDRMSLRFERASVTPQGNVPVVEGGMAGLAEHREQIVDGFTGMYRFLWAHRSSLLAEHGPLADLGPCSVRVLLRNTSVYGRLHQQLRDPRHLREGVDRSIQLEVLCRLFLDSAERPIWWPVVAAEQLAMERPDIPFLAAPANSDSLPLETGEIIECFREPSFHTLLDTVATLGEEDLARQVAFIEGSLYAHGARDAAAPAEPRNGAGGVDAAGGVVGPTGHPVVLTADELTARALAVADTLLGRSISGDDGSAAWIAPQYLVKVGRYQFQSVGYDLYGGGAGIGLALAAATNVTGDADLRRVALGALRPLRAALRDDPGGTVGRLGLGAAAGTGGAVLALLRAGQLLHD